MLLPVTPVNGIKSKEENDWLHSIHTISQQSHGIQYQLISSDRYQIHTDTMQSSLSLTSSPNTLYSFLPMLPLIPKASRNSSATTFSVVSDYPNELSPIEGHNSSLNSSQISTSR